MYKFIFYYSVGFLSFFIGKVSAQNARVDTISIKAKLIEATNEIFVQQEFTLDKEKDTIHLHAWINAYSNKKTALSKSKLQERNGDLYYAKPEERGGLSGLDFFSSTGEKLKFIVKENEWITVYRSKNSSNSKIIAHYKLKIPNHSFTGYGIDKKKNIYLKYFLLQPFSNLPKNNGFQNYLDMGTELSSPTFYTIELIGIENKNVVTYLRKENNQWKGVENKILEINILNALPQEFIVNNKKIIFTYPYKETDLTYNILENQLNFLEKILGPLPNNELILTEKNKKNNLFIGLDNIKITNKIKLENFSPLQQEAIQLFQEISYEYLNQVLTTNKQKDYWIKDGLQTYLSIKYIETAFNETIGIAGTAPEKIKLFGFKPLKYIYTTQLPLTERYNLMYSFLSRSGNDQTLDIPFAKLNKFNQEFMGGYRTGMIFKSIQDYLGENEFEKLIKQFIVEKNGVYFEGSEFTSFLEKNSFKPINWFKQNFIEKDKDIDFRLKKVKIIGDSLLVVIKNRTNYSGPFKISAYNKSKIVFSKWVEPNQDKISTIKIPKDSVGSVVLNLDSYLPELFNHDNYKLVGGLFNNSRKIKFSFFSGLEDPKYTQLVLVPKIGWNNQDKLLLGFNLSNATFFPKRFTYRVSSSYSTATNKLLNGYSLGYFFKWKKGFVEKLSIGGSYSSFNYSALYGAQSIGASSGVLFRRKNPRNAETNAVSFAIQSIKREISPTPSLRDLDYKNYQLYELGYNYANHGYIYDFSSGLYFEKSNLFNKITTEVYYRIRLSNKNRINYRLFGGFFLDNNTNSNSFDFGVSRVNDYKFRYQLLDRTNSKSLFTQQYILADAGFKSLINKSVNQWMVSNNIHINLNRKIGIFSDFAWIKSKNNNPEFIYDTGFSLTVIEDFLELYLPVQSSLGFEPSLGNYQNRIRFTFTFNIGSILNYWRRGKY